MIWLSLFQENPGESVEEGVPRGGRHQKQRSGHSVLTVTLSASDALGLT